MYKLKNKTYFAAITKIDGKLYIATTKSILAKLLGISVDTIRRHLNSSSRVESNDYILWKDIPIHKLKKRSNLLKYQ